ncbi:TetR/AcrR family transcriptional regulator [Geovibrio thiophilus]|uniref:TetR/AcrR family transcriptional regulator n=1 Tax=Geovibrio thiophilus TaxID=139438 RepID=A0A3R5XYK4_9BACT|nr:TetR/AcrR family transcriptional regulator [Geovibrio thiophilus]QAR34405.1 TetR/AcrR family transcriptional regulator [Geovibrio thiophilus]
MHRIDRRQIVNKLIKDTVYDSVMEILHESGSEKLTMEEVAAKAGVSKGTLYNYFKNKEDLMDFVEQQTIEPIIDGLREIRGSSKSAPEKLRDTSRFVFEIYRTRKDYVRYQKEITTYKHNAEISRRIGEEHFSSIWAQGTLDGDFNNVDPLIFKAVTGGALASIMDTWIFDGAEEPDIEKAVRGLEKIYTEGFIEKKPL